MTAKTGPSAKPTDPEAPADQPKRKPIAHKSVLTRFRALRAVQAAPDPEAERVAALLAKDKEVAKTEVERLAMGSFHRPDAPAVIAPDMAQDQPYWEVTESGSPITSPNMAYRRVDPLFSALDKGKLAGGSTKYGETQRYQAGVKYGNLYRKANEAGRDSTQAMNVSRSPTSGSLSATQEEAISELITIDSHMGARDRAIVRMVCGESYNPSEAVRTVCGDYQDTISARFREALDALVEAIVAARRNPKRFAG